MCFVVPSFYQADYILDAKSIWPEVKAAGDNGGAGNSSWESGELHGSQEIITNDAL